MAPFVLPMANLFATDEMRSVWVLILPFLVLPVLFSLHAAYTVLNVYWLRARRIRRFMESQGVKGPPPRFMVGNLFDMAKLRDKQIGNDMKTFNHNIVDRLLPHYVEWSKLYGEKFIFWWGTEPRLTVSEPEMIKEFLSSRYSQCYGRSSLQQNGSKHFIGKGLLMANGEQWAHQRHVVAPAFHVEKLKGHVGHMIECCKEMLDCLDEIVDKGGGGRCEIEISDHLSRLTGDIIARTEFGSSYEKGKRIFQQLGSLQQLSSQSGRYLWFPGNRFLPTTFNKEIKRRKKEVENLLMEIIQSRRDSVHLRRTTSYGNDLLGLMLSEIEKAGGRGIANVQLLVDECKTFFFTGHETTALLLTWTIMLLASNPAWQERARSEVLQVCDGIAPTPNHLPKLKLLGMILNESLRLYTPASLLPRQAFVDTKLGELEIPKGLSVWIPVLAIHHSEELWGKDANEFNPERFAEGLPKACKHPMGFIPFSAGPRNCVGHAFALMEAKIVLAMILAHFRFSLSPNYRHAPVLVLTLKPKHGLQIIVERL